MAEEFYIDKKVRCLGPNGPEEPLLPDSIKGDIIDLEPTEDPPPPPPDFVPCRPPSPTDLSKPFPRVLTFSALKNTRDPAAVSPSAAPDALTNPSPHLRPATATITTTTTTTTTVPPTPSRP